MFGGLLALMDDIIVIADDVASLTYQATKQTTGLVTDDMAVTAEQALGIPPERELPVVFKIAAGSMFNKAVILVPVALLLSEKLPVVLDILLMCGGAFLAFEGVEKIVHKIFHKHDDHAAAPSEGPEQSAEEFEKGRVWGAIRTDFILSAEIVVISLHVMQEAQDSFWIIVGSLYAVAILMTIGVYGAVAVLVKLDDIGRFWAAKQGGLRGVGRALIAGTPYLLRTIAWIGTIAMLLVGGSILLHGVEPVYHALKHALHDAHIEGWAKWGVMLLAEGGTAILVGGVLVGLWSLAGLLFKRQKAHG